MEENNQKIKNKNYLPLSVSKFQELISISESIFHLTNEVLIEKINQENLPISWIEEGYSASKHLWKDGKKGVNLMRIDYAWSSDGNFRVLELNTASQGGWLKSSSLERIELSNNQIGALAPNPNFYPQYLIDKLGDRIVFLAVTERYNKELDDLVAIIRNLGGKSEVLWLSADGIIEKIKGFSPTGLFIKSNSRIARWDGLFELLSEISKLGLPQIPSFESIFISGDKSFLEILKERDNTGAIPKTYALSKNNLELDKNVNLLKREVSVLKPSDLSWGRGVEFGKYFSDKEWIEKIKSAMNSKGLWVLQELCYLEKNYDNEYQDIVVFLADGIVKGIASRVSPNEVVNVAKEGRIQWVVLEKNKEETELIQEHSIEVPLKDPFYFD